jgi:hypothetical protein
MKAALQRRGRKTEGGDRIETQAAGASIDADQILAKPRGEVKNKSRTI